MQENSALSKYTDYVNSKIEESLRSNLPEFGADPQWTELKDTLFPGEELRIYAILTTLGARVIGGQPANLLPAAAAMEYVAYGTKLLQKSTGTHIALALLNQAYGLMFANTNISDERAIRAHNELVEFIGSGILLDETKSSGEGNGAEELSISASSLLIRLSLRVGAILAGADYLQLEALSRFAITFGRVFQLKEYLAASLTGNQPEGLTAELARNESVRRLVELIDEAKHSLDVHFSGNESAIILAQLTEALPGQQ
jgi:geranylgeranyl pyrophosphate synthase